MSRIFVVFACYLLGSALVSANIDFKKEQTLYYLGQLNTCSSSMAGTSGATFKTTPVGDTNLTIAATNVLGGMTLNCTSITEESYFEYQKNNTDVQTFRNTIYKLTDNTDNTQISAYNCSNGKEATDKSVYLVILANGAYGVRIKVETSTLNCAFITGLENEIPSFAEIELLGEAVIGEGGCTDKFSLNKEVKISSFEADKSKPATGLVKVSAESLSKDKMYEETEWSCQYTYSGVAFYLEQCQVDGEEQLIKSDSIKVYTWENGQVILGLFSTDAYACAETLFSGIASVSFAALLLAGLFGFLF